MREPLEIDREIVIHNHQTRSITKKKLNGAQSSFVSYGRIITYIGDLNHVLEIKCSPSVTVIEACNGIFRATCLKLIWCGPGKPVPLNQIGKFDLGLVQHKFLPRVNNELLQHLNQLMKL